jgi:hypothetical protein
MSPLDSSKVSSKEDLAIFVDALLRDHAKHGREWDNPDLPRYLEAMKSWIEDSDGYYAGRKEEPSTVSPWRRIADALAAARIYE